MINFCLIHTAYNKARKNYDGRNDLKCECKVCEKNGTANTKNWKYSGLYAHKKRIIDAKRGKYRCAECNISFPERSKLRYHLGYVHDEAQYLPFECKRCLKKFAAKNHLTTHQEKGGECKKDKYRYHEWKFPSADNKKKKQKKKRKMKRKRQRKSSE